MPEVLIAGDSHIGAFGIPTAREEPFGVVPVRSGRVVFTGLTGPRPHGPLYWKYCARWAKDRIVLILWKGNQHNASFLIRRPPLFDFILPSAPETVPGAVLVPEAVVRAHFAPTLETLPGAIRDIFEAGARDVLVLATPPTMDDDDVILRRISNPNVFHNMAKDLGLDLTSTESITPRSIRQKLWTLLQTMTREAAESAGATYLPVPAGTMNPDGSLPEPYWGRDVAHANEAYGQRVLDYVADFVTANASASPAAKSEAAKKPAYHGDGGR